MTRILTYFCERAKLLGRFFYKPQSNNLFLIIDEATSKIE